MNYIKSFFYVSGFFYWLAIGSYIEKNRGNEADLIAEMQTIGLNVGFLNTSGDLVRIPVQATPGVRPDKGNEKSGWYVINVVHNVVVVIEAKKRDQRAACE